MEKQTQTATPEPAAETGSRFPPRRKSPLKSETYHTLLKIFSLCQDLPENPEKAAQEQSPDDYGGGELGKASEKDASALTVLDDSLAQRDAAVGAICEDIGCKEKRGLTDTQVAMDEIDNMMGMEVDEEFLKQSEPMVGDYGKEQGLGDRGLNQAQQFLMDELEHAIKGNQELVNNSNCNIIGNEVAEENRSAAAVDGAVFDNQEKRTVLQPVGMGEFRSAGQQLVREEHHEQNVSEIFNSPMDKSVAGEVSNPGGGCKDKSSLESAGELGILYERSQKKFELEKPLSTTGTITSSSHMIENGVREEGEISGLLEVDDRSAVMSLEEGEFLEDKQIGEHVTDGNLPPMNEKSKSNVVGSDSLEGKRVDNANYSREVVAKESARIDSVCKRKIVTYEDPLLADEAPRFKNRKISHEASEQMAGNGDKKQESKRKRKKRKDGGSTEEKKGKGHKEQEKSTGVREQEKLAKDEIGHPITLTRLMDLDAERADQNTTGSQSIASEKKNADICNNSKRGGSKESKKMKKRKKRAERNRELGVKRLKLRPVLIPKPVVHCRHYLKGRCQEGEKCKFSHDVIPLTKSQPCCHFARHSCMKGENCPFDHQLSKYPCSNYATKGFCIRGESCMFSHKLPLMENAASTSNVSTPDLGSASLPSTSNFKNQVDIGGPSRQTTRSLPELSGINSSKNAEQIVASKVVNAPSVLPKGISFLSGGKPSMVESRDPKQGSLSLKTSEGVKVVNQIDQSSSSTVQNLSDNSKGTSAAGTPRGINFLSFGKSPLHNSPFTKNLAINQGGVLPLSSNRTVQLANPFVNSDASTQGGKALINKFSDTTPNYLSVGETSTHNSTRTKQLSQSSSLGGGIDKSVEASKLASNKDQTAGATKKCLLASPLGSAPYSDQLGHAHFKSTPNSVQKVMSTLAFAANLKSEKMEQSMLGAPGVNSRISKETGASSASGSSPIDSTNASNILAFLSSIGSQRKQ